jgi:hypothetical protein
MRKEGDDMAGSELLGGDDGLRDKNLPVAIGEHTIVPAWRGECLVLAQPTENAEQRLYEADRLLRRLSRRPRQSDLEQAHQKAQRGGDQK